MIERDEPPYQAGEKQTLLAFLEYQRQTLDWKCEGLSAEQLARRSMPPSELSLLGLLRHLADVEHGWFHEFAGVPVEFHYATTEDPDNDLLGAQPDEAMVRDARRAWAVEVAHSNEVAAAHHLDDSYIRVRGEWSARISLRWLLLHMIEEYARHNGHADLLREAIDGAVGE